MNASVDDISDPSGGDAFDFDIRKSGFWRVLGPDGAEVSRHTAVEYALESVLRHALANRQNGVYQIIPPGYEVETMGMKVASIPSPLSAGTVWVNQIAYSAFEGTTLTIGVQRGSASAGAIAVDWELTGLTEGAPAAVSGTLSWANGELGAKSINLQLGAVTDDRSGTFTLSNPRSTSGGHAPSLGTSVASVTVLNDVTQPTTPVLTATATSSSSINLSWTEATDNVGVTGYTLQRSTDQAVWTTIYTGTARSHSDNGRAAGTRYYYRVFASDAAGNASGYGTANAMTQSGGLNTVVPAVHPLELVSPRAAGSTPSSDAGTPAMPASHRIFKAYPGIEYNIRAVVIGGSYPYTFALSNAPAGMTINASTGEITWLNPQANATPTITVTDAEGTQRSSSWTITVTTTGFKFVDAVNGNDNNTGTISSPWQTLAKVHSSSAIGEIIYFRAGNYSVAGIARSSIGSAWERVEFGSTRSTQWIGYPGETAEISCGYVAGVDPGAQIRLGGSSTAPCYLDRLTVRNVRNMLLQVGSGIHFQAFRRLTLRDLWEGQDGSNPGGIMYLTNTGANPSYYGSMQDVEATNLIGGGAFKTYSQYKWLCENLYCHDSTGGPDVKAYTGRWEVRGCIFDRLSASYAGLFGNMNQDPAAGLRNNGEVRYNLTIVESAGQWAIDINQDGNSDQIDIYRNTFVGGIARVRNADSADGPFNFRYNVIVNENAGSTDRITLENVSDPSRVTYTGNLVGGAAAGIVDANGLLQGSYRTQYLGSRGHEIP